MNRQNADDERIPEEDSHMISETVSVVDTYRDLTFEGHSECYSPQHVSENLTEDLRN